MNQRAQTSAPAETCRDFEADLLARLQRHRATMHGCPVAACVCTLDGGIAIWFAGSRDGIPWRGALRFELPWLADKKLLADAGAVAEVALKLLRHVSLDRTTKLIDRVED